MLPRYLTFIVSIIAVPVFAAADVSPVGRWQVISDKTQQPVAIMKIFERDGEYRGMIDRILPPSDQRTGPRCDNCPGSLKGQPVEGLVVMQGLKRQGDQFTGGHILDPDSGEFYRVRMSVGPDGNTLKVRGYLGISLLGRTQTWYRID
jgi:uncharacterized protein (DUF2147 family)